MPNTSVPHDWHQPCDPLHILPSLSWTWEFLRRNPVFARDWSRASTTWKEMGTVRGVRVVQLGTPIPRPWPCIWAASLEADARHATIAWDRMTSSAVIEAVAVPPRCAFGATTLDLEALTVDKTLLVAKDRQHLLLRDGVKELQIDVCGTPLTEVAVLFVDTVLKAKHAATFFRALSCLRDLRATGRLPERYFSPHPRAERLAHVLQALDGYLAGATHREIAIALLGEERVMRNWTDPKGQLRDHVRRAIASGLALRERGFRGFLR